MQAWKVLYGAVINGDTLMPYIAIASFTIPLHCCMSLSRSKKASEGEVADEALRDDIKRGVVNLGNFLGGIQTW